MVKKLIKPTLIHVISGDLWAGAESQVYNNLYALKEEDKWNVTCLLFNAGILKNKLDAIGVKTYLIDENTNSTLLMCFKIYKLIREIRPSLLHVHHTKEHLLGLLCSMLIRKKIPLIRTVHGLHGVRSGLPLFQHLRSTMVVRLDSLLVKYFSTDVVAVSNDLKARLKEGRVNGKIHFISNSLSIEQNRANIVQNEFVDKYRPHSVFWIGTAARLVGVKNLDMLIDAGAILKKKGISFQISIFGDGPLKNRLNDRIIDHHLENEVKLHGFVDGMLDIVSALDIFVLCSKHEGLPMSLLEAMFLKTPVICTNVGGMAEVVDNRISGLLVENNDAEGLADAILCLINDRDLRNQIKENAKQVILDRFTTETAIKKLICVYDDAM